MLESQKPKRWTLNEALPTLREQVAIGELALDLQGRVAALSCCFLVLKLSDENAGLRSVSDFSAGQHIGLALVFTQLAFGSRNLHHTPSSRTSFILRQRFRKTPSIRFRNSMIA